MGGDTDITDIDSKGAPPGILDGWRHSYDRHRLNRGTTGILDEWGHSYDRNRLNRGITECFGWAKTLI